MKKQIDYLFIFLVNSLHIPVYKMKGILLILCFILLSIEASSQTITTFAGIGISGYSGDGEPASACKLNKPACVIFDKYGNVYITDNNNHSIRKINTLGIITTIAGNGIAGYSGDGGMATNAQLNDPAGIAVDNDENIYISDYYNHVIRKINADGIITTIAGTGAIGYSGDNGQATTAKLGLPYGICIDNYGNIFFSDGGFDVIRKINTSGIITTVAGSGIAGDSGEGGQATDAQLRYPGFIAIHPKTGELYIPVHYNRKVLKVNATGIILRVAGNGISGYDGDGGAATVAKMINPNVVCFDTGGNFYISDAGSQVIRKVNTSGIISTVAGTGSAGFNGDGNLATATQLRGPCGSAFDKWGNLYFADVNNHRVRRINYNAISGVNNLSKVSFTITIYPNPAKNEVTIVANKSIKQTAIINLQGQTVVIADAAGKKEIVIDVAQLEAGIYIIKADGIYVGRFVKE